MRAYTENRLAGCKGCKVEEPLGRSYEHSTQLDGLRSRLRTLTPLLCQRTTSSPKGDATNTPKPPGEPSPRLLLLVHTSLYTPYDSLPPLTTMDSGKDQQKKNEVRFETAALSLRLAGRDSR